MPAVTRSLQNEIFPEEVPHLPPPAAWHHSLYYLMHCFKLLKTITCWQLVIFLSITMHQCLIVVTAHLYSSFWNCHTSCSTVLRISIENWHECYDILVQGEVVVSFIYYLSELLSWQSRWWAETTWRGTLFSVISPKHFKFWIRNPPKFLISINSSITMLDYLVPPGQ